jgi:hypothetical protein
MNNLLRRQWYLTAASVLVFASASFAQATTQITLTGVGDGATLGNVYVDPYTATVGGVANTSVICDDWSTNTYLNEAWTANVINAPTVSNTTLGTPMFGNSSSLYNELAWLGTQLLANPKNATLQTEISFAMWELTYGANGTSTESPSPTSYLNTYAPGDQSAVNTLLAEAEAAVSAGFTGAGWEILTPASGWPTADGEPQEFLVYTPESPAAILLGADLLGLATLIFLFRRRMVPMQR